MPSFVSRLEESIFAAAWVHFAKFTGMATEEERARLIYHAELAVSAFREAEREAAKRAIPVAHVLRQVGEPIVGMSTIGECFSSDGQKNE